MTYFDAPVLMMYVVEDGVLLIEPLKRIPGKRVAAVVVDAFHHGEIDEPESLSRCQARGEKGDGGADGVNQDGFD